MEGKKWEPDCESYFSYCPVCDVPVILSQLMSGTEIKYRSGICCSAEIKDHKFKGLMWTKSILGINHYKFCNDARRSILAQEPFLSARRKMIK